MDGVDKPTLEVAGASMLDRVLTAVAGARQVVVAGPPRGTTRDVIWCREQPPGGGPVAAIAAGVAHTAADVVLVLAADLPWVAPAIPALVDALGDAGVALLVDASGRVNPLAAAWRRSALVAALQSVGEPAGAAARALVAAAHCVPVPDPHGWGRDCDTWADLAAARARARP